MVKHIVLGILRFYKRYISVCLPPACRFYPTCSEYIVQAVTTYGVGKGVLLGLGRLLRCNPFCKGGYDPVFCSQNQKGEEQYCDSII